MNVVRFNDSIEQMLRCYPDSQYILQFNGWQAAPLFDYVTTFEHEKERVAAMLVNQGLTLDKQPWPFETFRLALTETAVPWNDQILGDIGKGRYATNYVVTRRNGQMAILAQIKSMWDEKEFPYPTRANQQQLSFLITEIETADNDSFHFHFSMHMEGRWVEIAPHTRMGVQPIVGAAITGLATFITDAMAPSSHIATVRPNQPHKSLTWVMARTHYTLITHGHPANKATVQSHERIASDQNEELKRMAHNRRAHKRTLRAERYTFARGKTIDIRATWVGPREWQDQGGRQIYRILEPAI